MYIITLLIYIYKICELENSFPKFPKCPSNLTKPNIKLYIRWWYKSVIKYIGMAGITILILWIILSLLRI